MLLAVSSLVYPQDIRSTAHNLTKMGLNSTAEEVCVFCHTPLQSARAGQTASTPAAPAWQPTLPSGYSFVIYDDIGRLQFGDKAAVGSQSIACMSCHDSNQAFSVMSAASDHPFGIPYRGYYAGRELTDAERNVATAGPSRTARFLANTDEFRTPSQGVVDSRVVWWVSASGLTSVRGREDLPLYARLSEAGEIPYVECSSCHDPHIVNKLFLRVNNDNGSALCFTCHDK